VSFYLLVYIVSVILQLIPWHTLTLIFYISAA